MTLKRFLLLLCLCLVLAGCSRSGTAEPLNPTTEKENVMNVSELTQLQKEWLEAAEIPAEGDTLTEKQTRFLSLVGEMMEHLENRYHTGFRFSSCAPASVADPSVTLYAYQEGEDSPLGLVTVTRTITNGTVSITDDYMAAYCRTACQQVAEEYFAPQFEGAVRVFASMLASWDESFDGTQPPEELLRQGAVRGQVNIFLPLDGLSDQEQQELACQWAGWARAQGLRVRSNLCFVTAEQLALLSDYNFGDISRAPEQPNRYTAYTDSQGELVCQAY